MTADATMNRRKIAIVGMALRVPGASTLDRFWHHVVNGNDCLKRAQLDGLREVGYTKKQLNDPGFVAAAPNLQDAGHFDPEFFGMTAYEAERTEPAQRLFLECAYEALEHAGILTGRDRQKISVIAGSEGDYRHENLDHLGDDESLQVTIGNDVDFTTNRVANRLDLVGPTVTVLSACATSLTAVHLGMVSLRRGDCDVVVAGGSTVLDNSELAFETMDDGMISASGVVRPFDDRADGTVFGSGVSAVVLRPLEDALAAGQEIYGVLLGSGTSNDGNPPGKKSFTAPSPEGQVMAIEKALDDSGIDPATIGLAEAHGTATRLGDPTEIASLSQVYRRYTDRVGYCALGSAKANFGHLRTCAGGIGLIKACLAMRHGTWPRVANLEVPNSRADLSTSPFFVPMDSAPWPAGESPRRSGVSAFGFGGTNAHVIVEEAPQRAAPKPRATDPSLCFVSAKGQAALTRRVSDLRRYLEDTPDANLDDLAHTLRNGRMSMSHRAVFRVDPSNPAASFTAPPVLSVVPDVAPRKMVFLFPGQGSQFVEMGHEVYRHNEVYREEVDRCAALLEPLTGHDIRDVVHANENSEMGEQTEALRRTANTQPALFVTEYAMARQLQAWGVEPDVLLGHSVGELVAACLAGVFSLEDGLKIVAARSSLMQSCEPGAMLAVLARSDVFAWLLNDEVEIATLNAPALNVVSGSLDAIAVFEETAAKHGIATRKVRTSHAFHSYMMEPVLDDFRALLADIKLSPPKIPVISNVTGQILSTDQACDPAYWAEHIRHSVDFTGGVETLLAEDDDYAFIEVGPGKVLSDLVGMHGVDAPTITTLGTEERRVSGQGDNGIELCVGRIWQAGCEVGPEKARAGQEPRLLTLPTYPFQRRNYWLDEGESETRQDDALFLYTPVWEKAPIEPEERGTADDVWVVLHEDQPLAAAVIDRLRKNGAVVASVVTGDAFAATGDGAYRLRPGSVDDYSALFAALPDRAGDGRLRMLNLWLLNDAAEGDDPVATFESASARGHNAELAIVQAAHIAGVQDDLEIVVAGNGLLARSGEESAIAPEKAGVLGPALFIPLEMPYLKLRVVDITGAAPAEAPDWAVEALLAEGDAPEQSGSYLLRPEGRFAESLGRIKSLPASSLCLRERGVVLITGGVGGIGLELARDLFTSARARLVLTTRWEVPDESTWRERAKTNDKIGRALAAVVSLQDLGAEIMLVRADSTSLSDLEDAVAQGRARFGAIHGVVHAAGAATLKLALEEQPEVPADMLAKVFGALHLDRIFAQVPLDFLVHLSSQSTHVPIRFGQSAYSGANRVLNALAERRRAKNLGTSVALGWGPWEKTGMAAIFSEDLTRTSTDGGDESQGVGPAETAPSAQLGSDEVEISVLCRNTSSTDSAWTEVSGYVRATGSRVRDLEPGDAVIAVAPPGETADLLTLASARVIPVVGEAVLEYAAALPRAFLAADFAIDVLGDVDEDDCVLVLCGDSAPGRAAVQIATERGARVFVATSHPGDPTLPESATRLPADAMEAAAALRAENDDNGARVVVALQSDDHLSAAATALVPGGRLIDLAYGQRRADPVFPAELAGKSLCYMPIDVDEYIQNDPDAAFKRLDNVMIEIAQRHLTCPRVDVVALDEADGIEPDPGKRVVQIGEHMDPWRAKARAFFEHYGRGVDPAEGLAVFRNVLACDLPPGTVIVLGSEISGASEAASEGGASGGGQRGRPELEVAYRAASNDIEAFLVDLWEGTIGISGIGVDDDFFDLGGNSVMVIRILFAVFSEYEERLPSSIMALCPTIAELASEIGDLVSERNA